MRKRIAIWLVRLAVRLHRIHYIYDGAARATVDRVWESQDGKIILSDIMENVYYNEDKPIKEINLNKVNEGNTPAFLSFITRCSSVR